MKKLKQLILCGVALWLGVAGIAAAQEAPGPDVELLRKRLSIAQREAALNERRLEDFAGELRSFEEYLEPEQFERLMESVTLRVPAPALPDELPSDPDALRELLAAQETYAQQVRARLLAARNVDGGLDLETLRYKRLVDEVARETARVRGLELKHPIDSVILTREELKELLSRLLAKELTDALVRGESLTWQALGILPPDADLKLLYSGLLEEQVGGLFDDATGALYVVDTFDPKSFLGRVILAHEINHALQDQHFPIKDLPFRTANSDQNTAVAAVLEGDATMLMIEWGMQNFKPADMLGLTEVMNQGTEQLADVPPALVQALVFPYMGGMYFMTALQASGTEGWRDLPFRDPPQSTEQILHPEKYYAEREAPIEVDLPEWEARDGLEEVHRGVVGEWVTRLILTPPESFPMLTALTTEVLVNEPVAVAAAAGWGGDRFVAVASADDSRWFVAWKTVWDDALDADEFEHAFARRVAQWPGFAESDYRQWGNETDGRAAWIDRDGRDTWVVVASNGELLATAREWLGRDNEG
ncbi:MAG: hypothetical protein PWP23_1661 [Candidatus Sumerlaeota bacterium]|nr:hypothetical protein [Candidatus Sumerlaeota bacterium]